MSESRPVADLVWLKNRWALGREISDLARNQIMSQLPYDEPLFYDIRVPVVQSLSGRWGLG